MLHIRNVVAISILSVALLGFLRTSSASLKCETNNEKPNLPIKLLSNLPQGGILNLTFRSKVDDSIQPLLVKLPRNYTSEKRWPLLVTLHGLGDGPILAPDIEKMVQIGPYGRGSVYFNGIGEQDVFECINAAQNLFSIDENRIYLCGFSMGGTATFELGLKHPDFWAACVPVCGRCGNLDLIDNATFLPFWIHTGKKDRVIPPGYSQNAYAKAKELDFAEWRYTEHKNMAHSFGINWKEVESWLLTKAKTVNPKQITFSSKEPHRAYWIEVTGIKEYGKLAKICAVINNQEIHVLTDNTSNYTFWLNNNIIDLAKEIRITENGINIFRGYLGADGVYVKIQQDRHAVFKHFGLSGPLWDIYSNLCVLVYGTNTTNNSLIEAAKQCAENFANPPWMNMVNFKIVPDTSVSQEDIKENNLVLFGNVRTNKVLSQLAEKLPVRMNDNRIQICNMEYAGEDIGCILIYPNPLNHEKYIAVFSGNKINTINCFNKIWPRLNSTPKDIDFGIFELVDDDSVKWQFRTVFGSNWTWQEPDFNIGEFNTENIPQN